MLRASSLGVVLHPARYARRNYSKSQPLWTKFSQVSKELVDERTPETNSRLGYTHSVKVIQTGDAHHTPAVCAHLAGNDLEYSTLPDELAFQLPPPADHSKLRATLPTHFVKRGGAYPPGKPWQHLPLPLLFPASVTRTIVPGYRNAFVDDSFDDLDLSLLFDVERSIQLRVDRIVWRRNLLRVLGNTQSASQGWMAYCALVSVPFVVPIRHLRRLARLIGRNTPKTRTQFHRLLSVLTSIHQSGGKISLRQWNALIDNAGKGQRKARPQDFRLTLDMFTDMVTGKPPGYSLSESGPIPEDANQHNPLPDISTYNILMNHAANLRTPTAISRATSLLTASGVPVSRITHLTALKYYANAEELSGVRASLAKMRQQGIELGIDGINASMWAFACRRRLDITMKLYRVLRHNVTPETHLGPDDIYSANQTLLEENIVVRPDMVPNAITFTTIIQATSFHGNLNAALTVFMDMLSSNNIEMGAPLYRDEQGILKPSPYSPTLPVFRGLFLGFSRHGVAIPHSDDTSPEQLNKPGQWLLRHLQSLFEVFLALPPYIQPTSSTVYWAIVAFDKTSNHDRTLLRIVWTRIEDRFGVTWGSPQHRLSRLRAAIFDPTVPLRTHQVRVPKR
ncbi:hypothetical protein C8J57DRAFT_736043 [Mycena rebaudengoi]|nr:hypothetical protein C8J57DRAFT_736043 [Mycena rebaudengoi]